MVSSSGPAGCTTTGKTAELTVAQTSISDALHEESGTKKVTAKEAGCSRTAVSNHVQGKQSGRKKKKNLVGQDALSYGDNHNLEGIVKRRKPFKNIAEEEPKMPELQWKVPQSKRAPN